MCGENSGHTQSSIFSYGSSPRVRGKLSAGRHFAGQVGLIPALAGKTLWAGNMFSGIWAHPRAGGENRLIRIVRVSRVGSSPRWRGKQRRAENSRADAGLIPALAGKTPPTKRGLGIAKAHPRAGGENDGSGLANRRDFGSSPRWRGKPIMTKIEKLHGGLIPALAGKTSTRSLRAGRLTAHPRAGGENVDARYTDGALVGSSPRWRGKRATTGG